MKRPYNPTEQYSAETGDVERDFSRDQLAGIGKVAMAYNVVEEKIYDLFGAVTGLQNQMLAEIYTRIGGMDGSMAIIIHGLTRIGGYEQDFEIIRELMSEKGIFAKFKQYRDAVVHARSLNALAGIGIRRERRA
jgi:hypothetical protein